MNTKPLFLNTAVIIVLAATIFSCSPAAPPPQTPPKQTTINDTGLPKQSREEKWKQVLSSARKSGRGVVYGTVGADLRTALTSAFREKYGIELDFFSANSSEFTAKYLKELSANLRIADAFVPVGTATPLNYLRPQGVLAPVEPRLILPEVTDPNAWPEGKIPYLDNGKLVVMLVAAYMPFVLVSTEQVKQGELVSYSDLLDPKWKGKIIIYNPTLPGNALTWVTFILHRAMNFEDGVKYLRNLAKQEPLVIKDNRLPVEWVARGKYPIAVAPVIQVVNEFYKAGAPITLARMKEGGFMGPGAGTIALPDVSLNSDVGTVLVNWLLTQEGQTVFSKGFGSPPIRKDVPGEGFPPIALPLPGEKLYWQDEQTVTKQQEEAQKVAMEIFGSMIR